MWRYRGALRLATPDCLTFSVGSSAGSQMWFKLGNETEEDIRHDPGAPSDVLFFVTKSRGIVARRSALLFYNLFIIPPAIFTSKCGFPSLIPIGSSISRSLTSPRVAPLSVHHAATLLLAQMGVRAGTPGVTSLRMPGRVPEHFHPALEETLEVLRGEMGYTINEKKGTVKVCSQERWARLAHSPFIRRRGAECKDWNRSDCCVVS